MQRLALATGWAAGFVVLVAFALIVLGVALVCDALRPHPLRQLRDPETDQSGAGGGDPFLAAQADGGFVTHVIGDTRG